MGTCQGVLCCSQDEVSSDSEERRCCNRRFVKCWVKVEPIDYEKSKILIPHNNIDKEKRDSFGANLVTCTEKRKDGSICYIHSLEDVSAEGPAGQLEIRNKDKLIFFNENFVQDMKQKEVLDLFDKLNVDGKTTSKMVLKRAKEWIRSEAVFEQSQSVDNPLSVLHLKVQKSRQNYSDDILSQHRYEIPEQELFLKISDGKVSFDTADKADCDRTTIVWKTERAFTDKHGPNQEIIWEAALSDVSQTRYIGIEGQTIVLKEEPVWFTMEETSLGYRHFKINEMCLGYEMLGTNQANVKILRHGVNSECGLKQTPASCIGLPDFKNEIPKKLREYNVY